MDADASWTAGKFGNGLLTTPLNGATVAKSASLDAISTGMSIGAWFRVDADSDTGIRRDSVVLLEDQAAAEQLPDGWVFAPWLDGGIILAWGGKKVSKARWTHVAGVYDGSSASLYIDGELDNSVNAKGKFASSGNALGIGKYGAETFTGGIDELFLYNRGVTREELRQIVKGYTNQAVEASGKLTTRWASLKQR